MELNEYQRRALETDQEAVGPEWTTLVPLLGLAGEVGELLSEYKKHLRDGAAHKLFPSRVSEELGDMLWYVAAVSSRFGLDLETVATSNLKKCADTWTPVPPDQPVTGRFDADNPPSERFPARFVVEFQEVLEGDVVRVKATCDGVQMGQTLTDNANDDDGYRFHDVLHLGLAAGLGWSPVSRRNLGLKRKSDPGTDEVEDGGRAIVIEEGIVALAFSYAMEHAWLLGVDRIDHDILRMIKKMTAHLEVAACTVAEWEATILMSCPIWYAMMEDRGGRVEVNLDTRSLRLVT